MGGRRSAIGYPLSAIGSRLSALGSRRLSGSTSVATLALAGALAATQVSLLGDQRPDPQPPADAAQFSVTTQAVVLDVVVRDRHHQPLRGLRADAFEVRENGTPQKISAFQAIEHPEPAIAGPQQRKLGPPREEAAASARPSPSPLENAPTAVAVVFENLGPEGRVLAHQAALDVANTAVAGRALIGVYVVRRSLESVLPFSDDRDTVRTAVAAAASRPGCPVLDTDVTTPGVRGGTLTACAGEDDHRTRGVSTLDALTHLARDLGRFSGRKVMALFSEGLDFTTGCRGQFCDDRRERLRDLIAEAGRHNVAIYTFDAAGLRLASTATGQLMAEPRAALTVLARETGGVFSGDTNDLRPAVDRMLSDLRAYYMLGYATEWPIGSSRSRSVDVRVRVKGAYVLVRRTVAPPR